MYAKVAVEVETARTDELFTYIVPEAFKSCIYIGSRVFVEFGFRKVLAYVIELTDAIDFEGNLKEIIEIVDFEQGLTPEQIDLARFIALNTKSFLTSCLGLMYPGFMKSKLRKYINVLNYQGMDAELAMLLGMKKRILLTRELLAMYPKIKKEEEKGNLEIETDVFTYGNRLKKRYYKIGQDYPVASFKRRDILNYLRNVQEATADEIKDNTGCSDFLIERMLEEKYLEYEEKLPPREEIAALWTRELNFNFEQQQLKEKFLKLEGKPFLLYSNDEDFKLDFYFDLALATVKAGKQVLIITPTILQNKILSDCFRKNSSGYRIYTLNSRLSNNEYYYAYKNIQAGNVDIVIGMKNHIFLPMNNLGLIILVSEESSNYQIEQNPRYNVLEVLKYRSKCQQAKLLLSSGALRVETYYQYFTAKYYFLKYLRPYPAKCRLVKMREELEDLVLSRSLREALERTLAEKKVAMLILNNISYNTNVLCKTCGHYLSCPKCKVSLVYHKEKGFYRCPSCNFTVSHPVCGDCGSDQFRHLGFGLEKLKESCSHLFPKARIFQVDSASMQGKEDYEAFFSDLEEKEIDILIGTNMLLDLYHPDISLIGLINADGILNLNDYRAAESAYTTIALANNHPDCEVFVQAYYAEHPAIIAGINNDFESFYQAEIEIRKNFLYPPFSEVNTLTVSGEYKEIYYYANYFKKIAIRIFKVDILGPVYVPRLKGIRLIIRHQDFPKLSELIDEVNRKFKDLTVYFERYPKSF
ncbi:MAG: primosomal protein N' [Acholeplasmataceae bacterium]|nr:primosomal protein N' [Acholeplasmataceae bacterium]